MKPYFITLKNSTTKEIFHRAVFWAYTFSEAAHEAYLVRASKGYDWQISGVVINTQWDARQSGTELNKGTFFPKRSPNHY
jgi:hypothetical protein